MEAQRFAPELTLAQYRNRFALPLDGHPEGWRFYNDAFLFDLRSLKWLRLDCKGPLPACRVGHRYLFPRVAVPCPRLIRLGKRSVIIKRTMWLFGGTYLDSDFKYHYFGDVWTLDLGMFFEPLLAIMNANSA